MVVMETNVIRVLIADDHPPVRAGIRSMLAGVSRVRPCLVDEAGTTEDAYDMVDRAPFDVVLMDYNIPGTGGDAATRLILARRPETRVLALSNYTDRAYVMRMVRAGARGYVAKTVEADALYGAIRAVLADKPYYSNEVGLQWMGAEMFGSGGNPAGSLSRQERQVIRLVLQGLRDKEIGAKLFLSPRTIEKHRRNAMMKLGVHNLVDLVTTAQRLGLF